MINKLNITDAIVGITDKDSNFLGTGFFLSKNEVHRKNIIVTCAHCLVDYEVDSKVDIFSKFTDQKITSVARIILKADIDREDVAFLVIESNPLDITFNGLELMNFEETQDDAIETYGYSDLSEYDALSASGRISNPKYVSRNKESLLYPKIEVDLGFSVPGFSGAPVWSSKSGQVIGIIQERERIDDLDIIREKEYLIPSKTILEVFNNLEYFKLDLDASSIDVFEKFQNHIEGYELKLRKYPRVTKSRLENGFVGRKKQLEEILNLILDNDTIAVTGIQGMGGIGKTAITIEVCHIIMETWEEDRNFNKFSISEDLKNKLKNGPYLNRGAFFEDGILWVEFKEEVGIVQVLQELGKQIGMPITDGSLEDRFMLLYYLLYKKNILIVLDSVEQNSTNFKFILEIFQKLDCPIIITSRVEILGAKKIDIEVMQPEDAIELFQSRYFSDDKELTKKVKSQITTICETVGHLPLAIKLLASWGKENTEDLETLLDKLKNSENKLELLKLKNPNSDDVKNQDAYLSFSLSYNDDRLDFGLKKLFAYAGTYRYPFSKDSLYNILLPTQKEKVENNSLDKLCALSLIEKNDDNSDDIRYYLHPLMREFALKKLREDHREERVAFERKKNTDLTNLPKMRKPGDHYFSDSDILEMISTCYECIHYEMYKDFFIYLDSLDPYLFYASKWESKISLLRAGISTAENLNLEHKVLKYNISLADVLKRQNKSDESEELFEKSMELAINLGSWNNYFFAYSKVFKNNDLTAEKWVDLLQKLRSSFIYRNTQINSGFLFGTIGSIYYDFKYHKFGEAIIASGSKDWHHRIFNLVIGLLRLIEIEIGNKNYQKSIEYCHQLLEQASTITGFEIKELVIYLYEKLINCHLALDDLESAELFIEKFNSNSQEIGLLSYADAYSLLKGQLLMKQSKFDAAIQYFKNVSDRTDQFWVGKAYLEKGITENNKEQKDKDFRECRTCFEKIIIKAEREKKLAYKAEILLWMIKLNFIQDVHIDQSLDMFLEVNHVKNDPIFQFVLEDIYEEVERLIQSHLQSDFPSDKKIKLPDPVFLIRDLPHSIMGKDKKEMMLVESGIAIVGDGEIKYTKSAEILDDINVIFEPAMSNYAILQYTYPYYIDKYPVTNKEYALYCKSTGATLPKHWDNETLEKFPNHPVTNIIFNEASRYAIWTRKRIPTEIEWEKACRGENGSFYPWGNDKNGSKVFDQVLNQAMDSTFKVSSDIKTSFQFVFGTKLFLEINLKTINDTDYFNSEEGIQIVIGELKTNVSLKFDIDNKWLSHFPNRENIERYDLLILKLLALTSLSKKLKISVLKRAQNLNEEAYWKLIKILLAPILKEILQIINGELKEMDIRKTISKRKRLWLLTLQEYLDIPYGYEISSFSDNKSEFGVYDMMGNVMEIVDKEIEDGGDEKIFTKGSMKGEKRAGYHNEILSIENDPDIFKNIGFRCVKPIFVKSDFEYFKTVKS